MATCRHTYTYAQHRSLLLSNLVLYFSLFSPHSLPPLQQALQTRPDGKSLMLHYYPDETTSGPRTWILRRSLVSLVVFSLFFIVSLNIYALFSVLSFFSLLTRIHTDPHAGSSGQVYGLDFSFGSTHTNVPLAPSCAFTTSFSHSAQSTSIGMKSMLTYYDVSLLLITVLLLLLVLLLPLPSLYYSIVILLPSYTTFCYHRRPSTPLWVQESCSTRSRFNRET